MAEQNNLEQPKLPEAVGKVYELKGYQPGVITFQKGIGEVDLRTVSLEKAAKISEAYPHILVKIEGKKADSPKP